MFPNIKRILKFAWNDFSRNWTSNIVVVFVMILVISLISSLFVFQGIAQHLIDQVKGDIDVSVYFVEETQEEQVLQIKEELLDFTEIKELNYISREEALQRFEERHQDNPVLLGALEEIGENPFLSYLNMRTRTPEQYENIITFLERSDYQEMIDEIDYLQKRPVIERLSTVSSYIERIGVGVAVVLALIAILVIFNAIKLAIYNSKEEISTMKLVGASNWFVRGPFIIHGALYGLVASSISFLGFILLSYFLSPRVYQLLLEFNLFDYLINNILILIIIQFSLGVGLGVISSLIVIHKHLKV